MLGREHYEEYLRRFNARDYAGVFAFYADDPELSFFGVTIRSLEDMQRFYGFLHAHVDEQITLRRFAASEELMALEATVRIEALKDLTAEALADQGYSQFHPMQAGDVIEMEQMIHYHLKDGKFTTVRCALVE
ncbi:MAG: nuclear transport factor 2 family protein [Sphingomonas bacterium]|nr:nuclear transport factor 2 family protein [Sphingomonas bacterium]